MENEMIETKINRRNNSSLFVFSNYRLFLDLFFFFNSFNLLFLFNDGVELE